MEHRTTLLAVIPHTDVSLAWHPSAASGEARRIVMVGVKNVDRAAVRAGEYAERIPAAACRALHAATGSMGDDVTSAWSVTMPAIPLEVVAGEDVVSAFAGAIRRAIEAPQVREVVVVLARRAPGTTGSTMRRLVTTLREIDGVTPIVLPPPRP